MKKMVENISHIDISIFRAWYNTLAWGSNYYVRTDARHNCDTSLPYRTWRQLEQSSFNLWHFSSDVTFYSVKYRLYLWRLLFLVDFLAVFISLVNSWCQKLWVSWRMQIKNYIWTCWRKERAIISRLWKGNVRLNQVWVKNYVCSI